MSAVNRLPLPLRPLHRSVPGPGLTRPLMVLLAAGLMAACAAPQPDPAATPDPDPEIPAEIELAPEPLAEHRLERIEALPDEQAEPEELRAAIDAVLALDPVPEPLLERAEAAWNRLPDAEPRPLADRVRGGWLAWHRGEADLAAERLGADDPDDPTRTPEFHRRGMELHARLLEWEQQWYQALNVRFRLDSLLTLEPDLQTANHERIWGLMAALRPTQRERLGRENIVGADGWHDLFRGLGRADDAAAAETFARRWQQAFPRHPANSHLPELLAASPASADPAGDTVVLLPLSGNLAGLGEAVLDGITRAHYADGQGQLRVRDTRGDPRQAVALYRDAVLEGADHIIGPLQRDAVAAVADLEEHRPGVLLNRTANALPRGITTLALDPEADARAVADRAARTGWGAGLGIIAEGAFGDRLASAWSLAAEEHGAPPREVARVDTRAGDLNDRIAAHVGIDRSRERIASVSRRLGLGLEGDPQIRADVGYIFVAGSAADVRRIAPHLHFHQASRLPMMSTPHVYPSRPDASRDRDLNGIAFPDAPGLFSEIAALGNTGAEPLREQSGLPRFYALGMDARRLAVRADTSYAAPHTTLVGTAGEWQLNPLTGDWQRTPAWARFVRGEPRRLDAATPSD